MGNDVFFTELFYIGVLFIAACGFATCFVFWLFYDKPTEKEKQDYVNSLEHHKIK